MSSTLVHMLFGSYLYGTQNENSDKDYKKVIIPSYAFSISEKKFSNFISTSDGKCKNKNTDIDFEEYTLFNFLNLLYKNDTSAIDMIHATKTATIESSEEWEYLVNRRTMFYSKNMDSYLGYCKHQAAKYSLKGSRMDVLENTINYLKTFNQNSEISTVSLEHLISLNTDKEYIEFKEGNYYIFGKCFLPNTLIKVALYPLIKMYNSIGERTKLARDNKGIDYKAFHHAFRAGYQLKSIAIEGDFSYPLKETPLLMSIKRGEKDFDFLINELDSLINLVTECLHKSSLPDNIPQRTIEFFNDWCLYVYMSKQGLR